VEDAVKRAQSEQQKSHDYAVLLAYVEEQPHGAFLEYKMVEDSTGVAMDTRGKAKLRRALVHCHRPYLVVRDTGYILSTAKTGGMIVADQVRGVVRRTRRAQGVVADVRGNHFTEMSPEAQVQLLFSQSSLGAIALAAENDQRQYGQQNRPKHATTDEAIALPLFGG